MVTTATVFRYQRSIIVAWTLLLVAVIGFAGETLLRAWKGQEFGYYTGRVLSKHLILYPFGSIQFNSDGYPDREWDLSDPRPHIALWGDSITSGVGAGYGYRFSDLLAHERPDKYFMNFGGPGEDGVADESAIQKILSIVTRFRIAKVIYAMDLNDLVVNTEVTSGQRSWKIIPNGALRRQSDALRRHSYLYSYLYMKAKNAAARFGYRYQGDEAYEFYPAANAKVIAETVSRINELEARLAQQGVQLCVLLFPYEMQISTGAASSYRRYGITWSDEFLAGEPQRQILRQLAPGVSAIDLKPAFGSGDEPAGTYFVFDRGGALDWIHPNRLGHGQISRFLSAQDSACY